MLGIHQDAVVGEQTLRDLAASVSRPAQALAIGRLIERERARQEESRAQWWDAWRKLKKAG